MRFDKHGLGQHLRNLRTQAGVSMQDAADRMGINRSVISQLETGKRDPQMSTVLRYCDAIGARIHIGLTEEAK